MYRRPSVFNLCGSILYKSWNCDVIGMTNMPEARLAREAEMGYASIAMVTIMIVEYSHSEVTVEQVLNVMFNNTKKHKIYYLSF